ncbi:MAG: hypothetical protein Q7T18_04985 [Sedimentisphaerales bacterium]|nr:hypothetical protein [Sedimentisphaerales bacterium]
MNQRVCISLVLLVMYLPVVVLASASITVCMAENGDVKFEFGSIACDVSPFQQSSSDTANNCGDCTDSKPVIGETHRIVLCSNFNIPLIQNTISCQVVEQKTSRVFCYLEPTASGSDLVGTCILII